MTLAKISAEAEAETIAQRVQQARAEKETGTETETREDRDEFRAARRGVEDGLYWFEDGEEPANLAFWAAYVSEHGTPDEDYAREVHDFTMRTGVSFEMDFEDELGLDGTGTASATAATTTGEEVEAGVAFAAKGRHAHDESNPTKSMLKRDDQLANKWRPSMVKERGGINLTSHEVTKEYAHMFGVTPHVTARTTKRDGTLKTRFAIDGRHEIRRGRFPNKDALYSPAMDEELLRLSIQYAATLEMEMGKSDVVQCFTHNPMATARFKRRLIVFMDEYESGVQGGQYREFDSVSYGTADASSEWYLNMSREMMGPFGFSKSAQHPCLFYKGTTATQDLIMVSVATDDMLRLNMQTPEAQEAMAEFKEQLERKWPVTHQDGDEFREILGVEIERGQDGDIRCTQPAEMRKIRAAFFGDSDVPEVLVPLHPDIETAGNEQGGSMFEGDDESEDARAERATPYRSLLGKLGYIRITRIDVLHTLSVLAERAHRPTRRDVHGLYWLAAYLLTTERVPLTFHPVDIDEAMTDTC